MTFKEMRQKMGLTQKQVSDIYRIPYSTVQKWEHNINTPPEYILKMMWELYIASYKDRVMEGNFNG
jgi:DNA-binding transcriptional regulator YiaG